ncbi:TIGR01777 family protein [Nocardioides guangzhouensis]|uniref:TIGR01777 family protein n=1 Tax=Nocardioides guangzhouensis TaxID=2497878 RepID=A0A4Q4Z917_9ACTN|nr:TIGR01777 family oxidoreductase [Nocardioides guangzhouensis]RYP84323.1 TIGR01777 family protein [Nocardioides guangzhouensis]
MQVVIAGASGFLGSHLTDALSGRGHDVTPLVRREAQAGESQWDPYAGEVDRAVIEEADVVVNVAGTRLLGNPHSTKYRRTLHDSRVVTTRVLADAVAASAAPPAFIAQNASAWYGDHGDQVLTEESDSRGDAFMTQVARDWQDATTPATEAGARVCVLRTVPVVHPESLTLKVLTPAFRLGLGARLGDGRHYFPVISLQDWVNATILLLEHATAAGPFNLTSPDPCTNREFTDAFADAVGRRARLAVPAPLLRIGAGKLAPETLGSFRLVPAALEALGYQFQDRDVREIMGRTIARA